ncbi:DNA polymerase delta subunit 4 [Irineochytrium annulatum]|nr:DNA polymerase delta subunit 4 [Irineochytrium annulatum]
MPPKNKPSARQAKLNFVQSRPHTISSPSTLKNPSSLSGGSSTPSSPGTKPAPTRQQKQHDRHVLTPPETNRKRAPPGGANEDDEEEARWEDAEMEDEDGDEGVQVVKRRKSADEDPADEDDEEDADVSPLRHVAERRAVDVEVKKLVTPRDEVIEVLRQFDLNNKFGNNMGMTRLERWQRAEKLGLSPPQHIKDILTRPEFTDDEEIREGLWHRL